MKKLVLLVSFVFALGMFTVNASNSSKKIANKAPQKTEATAKPVSKGEIKKAHHKSVKKTSKKEVTPAK